MLDNFFSNRAASYSYTHCDYSKPSYLFNGNSITMSADGTQRVDLQAPSIFAKILQKLVENLNLKHVWFLDDEN